MSLFVKKSADGSFTNINDRPAKTYADGSVDLPVSQMPIDFAPWTYDTVNKLLVSIYATEDARQRSQAQTVIAEQNVQMRLLRCALRDLLALHHQVVAFLAANATVLTKGTKPVDPTWPQLLARINAQIANESSPTA